MARSGRGGQGGQHGGPRTPAQPAAVSGPGALSARTDGGPGQPIRVASGGDYGARQASVQQQQAAPLASGGGVAPPPGPGVAAGAPPVAPLPNPFGSPTNRPGEPVTAGASLGPGAPPADPRLAALAALQATFAAAPLPEVQAMIEQAQREAGTFHG